MARLRNYYFTAAEILPSHDSVVVMTNITMLAMAVAVVAATSTTTSAARVATIVAIAIAASATAIATTRRVVGGVVASRRGVWQCRRRGGGAGCLLLPEGRPFLPGCAQGCFFQPACILCSVPPSRQEETPYTDYA